MTNLAKTGEIIEKVLLKFMEEKFEREWVGLTDDEVTELFCDYDGSQFPAFVRAIETKLKEKNHD